MHFVTRHLMALALLAAASAPASLVQAATKSRPSIANPDWLQKPTGDQMADLYPKRALLEHVSGRTLVTCGVTAKGALEACYVRRESPKGFGFGDAALAATAFFLMTPKTVDGQPVEGGIVTVPLTFEYPDERLGDGAMVLTRIGTAASPIEAGDLYPCPDGYGQCQAHYLTWTTQPDFKLSRRMLAQNAPRTGSTYVACTAGVDGSLQGCAYVGDTSKTAMAIIGATLERLRVPEKADDGLVTATTTVVIPFLWDWLDGEITKRADR